MRHKLASSHEGRYTYWLDADRYVYQFNTVEQVWNGWLCSQPSWESTFSRSTWMTLEKVSH